MATYAILIILLLCSTGIKSTIKMDHIYMSVKVCGVTRLSNLKGIGESIQSVPNQTVPMFSQTGIRSPGYTPSAFITTM